MKNINFYKQLSVTKRLEEKSDLRSKINKTEAQMETIKLFDRVVALLTSAYEAFVGLGKIAAWGTISIGTLDATAIFTIGGCTCLVLGILVYRFLAIKKAEYQTDFENLVDAETIIEKETEKRKRINKDK